MSGRVPSGRTLVWEVPSMGIRKRDREVIERLDSKTLDARFTTEIQQGLNCSPFAAEAVLDVVKEVYFPFLSAEAAEPPPGNISLVAVAADEPAGKPVADCQKLRSGPARGRSRKPGRDRHPGPGRAGLWRRA